MNPADYPRRILLAVTGLTPQVVTETLYALAAPPVPSQGIPLRITFVPSEIHLITTTEGAERARLSLLDPATGQFHALCRDYGLTGIAFGPENIHTIPDAAGNPLADIRTPEDNTLAADCLLGHVRRLCADDGCALHVSIAGGRKTMGFFLGYALSLFGRAQDRLSHVLVSEPFESLTDFYFPPAAPRVLHTRDGRPVHTADARITLAEIPFVRLRHGLPTALQNGEASFGDAVVAVQESLAPPNLEIDLGRLSVSCGGRSIAMKPQLLAWYAWWAWLRKNGRGGGEGFVSWRAADAEVAAFLAGYGGVVGFGSTEYGKTAALLANGMEKEFFQQKNSKLERVLKDALGLASQPYLLAQTGERPHTRRGLTLPPEAIHLVGMPPDQAFPKDPPAG